MARHLIPSDTAIRTIKPGDPRKRLSDGDGLVLLLFVNGSGEAIVEVPGARAVLITVGT